MNFKKLEKSGIADVITIDGVEFEPEELAGLIPYMDISEIKNLKMYTNENEIYLEEVETIDELLTDALLNRDDEVQFTMYYNEVQQIYEEVRQRAKHPGHNTVGKKR